MHRALSRADHERLLSAAARFHPRERMAVRGGSRGEGDKAAGDVGDGAAGTAVPGMKLVIELDGGEYEAVESGEALYLVDNVTAVEIRQADGLLNMERKVSLVDGLSAAMSYQQIGRASCRERV